MTLYFELTSSQGTPARIALQPGLQRIKAAIGDRYRIYDDATGKTPPDIVVKRLDSHMIIEGLPDGAAVELTDFYARCGVSSPCTFVVDSDAVLLTAPVEISPASPPLQALTDGSFVVYPSGYSREPAIAVADGEGFPAAAGFVVGGRALLARAGEAGGLTARGWTRTLRLARTIADLDGERARDRTGTAADGRLAETIDDNRVVDRG